MTYEDQHDRGRREGDFLISTLSEIEKELPFHLVGAGCDFYQYPIERAFGYPSYQWIQTISGSGTLTTERGEQAVPEGHGMLLYPDEPHAYRAAEGEWYVHWMTFHGYHIERMLHQLGLVTTGVYSISEPVAIAALIRKAYHNLQSDHPLKGLEGSALVYQLLLDLFKYAGSSGRKSQEDQSRRLRPALEQIERDLEKPIAVDDLATTLGVTPQHFCVLFKNLTGLRPTEYINNRRIERAKDLLFRHPSLRVHEVARQVGFESDSYFSTIFRKHEGVSPRQYRELHF